MSEMALVEAHGIDIVEIRPRGDQAMSVTFTGDPETTFDVTAAGRRSDGWETARIVPTD